MSAFLNQSISKTSYSQCNTSHITILGYVVGLGKPAYESRRISMDPPKPLHPDQRETSEDFFN